VEQAVLVSMSDQTRSMLAQANSHAELSLQQLRAVVSQLFRVLQNSLQDEPASARECLRRAEIILRSNDAPASPPVSGGLALWQVRKVTAHIEVHLDTPIRNDDLAALVRLNPCHFCRAFRKSVGHSPHGYVMRRRIARAQELMLSGDAPLSQIAFDCGLADQAHLSRLFRRLVGDSPSAWRRAHVERQPDAEQTRSAANAKSRSN
jgi:AraC family transcriptional regulator